MTANVEALRAGYTEELRRQGLTDTEWIASFQAVPREAFVPRFFRRTTDGRWQGVDASSDDYWAEVYGDRTLVTQLDGAREPDPHAGPISGTPSSSSSQPSIMALMLEALDMADSERVLEIGTPG